MSRLILVRHGEPAAGWDVGDPGLSEVGRAQAEAMAEVLGPTGPLPVVTSPMRRTRETAAALEARWNVTARVEPAVGAVPMENARPDRHAWLADLLATPVSDWPDDLQAWRRTVLDCLRALDDGTVVVTHYVAITAVAAPGCRPDYCSRTAVTIP